MRTFAGCLVIALLQFRVTDANFASSFGSPRVAVVKRYHQRGLSDLLKTFVPNVRRALSRRSRLGLWRNTMESQMFGCRRPPRPFACRGLVAVIGRRREQEDR